MQVLNLDTLEWANGAIFDFEYDEELIRILEKTGDKDTFLFEQI